MPRSWPALCTGVAGLAMGSAWALDLNQATRAEVESARGVGVGLAERLIQARQQAPFSNWDDARSRVKGLSVVALKGLHEAEFTLNGQPPPTTAAPQRVRPTSPGSGRAAAASRKSE